MKDFNGRMGNEVEAGDLNEIFEMICENLCILETFMKINLQCKQFNKSSKFDTHTYISLKLTLMDGSSHIDCLLHIITFTRNLLKMREISII